MVIHNLVSFNSSDHILSFIVHRYIIGNSLVEGDRFISAVRGIVRVS